MIIDAHIHLGNFSVQYPLAESRTEKIVEMLREEGVDYAVASSARALFFGTDAIGNQEIIEAAKKYKEIIPMMVLNPWHIDDAMKLLHKYNDDGFVRIKMHPNCHKYCLASPIAYPIFEFCEKEGIPIMTHSSGGCSLSGAGPIRKVAENFPDLKLVIGHGGIFSDRDVALVANDHENLFIEISVEYEAGKLEDTIRMIGSERIMFGSDCPIHHPSVMLQRVKVMKLSKEDEDNILYKTASKLYNIKV